MLKVGQKLVKNKDAKGFDEGRVKLVSNLKYVYAYIYLYINIEYTNLSFKSQDNKYKNLR